MSSHNDSFAGSGSSPTEPDFLIETGGRFCTVYLIRPLNQHAKNFLYSRLDDDAHLLDEAVRVEHRFVSAMVDDLRSEGFVVC